MLKNAFTSKNNQDDHWYLVHCKARKEVYAAHALQSLLQLLVFLPEGLVRSRGKIKTRPFFPGYIFIKGDLHKVPVSQINACPGVLRLVTFEDDPQPVPSSIVEVLSERLIIANQHMQNQAHFRPGDLVRVKHGPMRELEMIFVKSITSHQRVCVLLHLLGRCKKIQIHEDMLEKVTTADRLYEPCNQES